MAISLSDFADKINEIMPTIIKEFSRQHSNELFKGKITLPQFLILHFLHKNGESCMTDLARFMGVTTAAMTGMIDRLVKYGYVGRDFNPNDRRVINIKPTTRGSLVAKKISRQRKKSIVGIFCRISNEDRENYLRILTQIEQILIGKKTS